MMTNFRTYLASLLHRLADWIAPTTVSADVETTTVVWIAPNPLLDRARALVREQDTRWPDRDGESKRHQVYARLIKDFPGVSKRALARLIEEALD